MIFKNAKVIDSSFELKILDVEIEDGIIKNVAEQIPYTDADMVVDCEGYTIIPGLIDIHIHGCMGFDASDGTREAIEEMAKFLLSKGVTTFCPTTMTQPVENIEKAFLAIKDSIENPVEGARVAGINMEGPFISAEKRGAQKQEDILEADFALFERLYNLSGKNIKLVDVAPEVPNGYEFICKAKDLCRVSLAHTTGGYDDIKKAFEKGASHITHLYNAMKGFSHREPGAVGAVFDTDKVSAEIICDGFHIHPAVLRSTFKLIADRLVIISDSMRANGLPEGEISELGGQEVIVKDGKATLSDGTLAGSVTNIFSEIKNLVEYGVPFEAAVKAATINPAKVIGVDDKVGSIENGKLADLLILDENMDIVAVYH